MTDPSPAGKGKGVRTGTSQFALRKNVRVSVLAMRNFAATDQSQAAMGRRRSVQTGTGQFALRMNVRISVLAMTNFAVTDQSQVVKRKCVQTGTGQFVLRMSAKKLTTISVITVIRILVK